MKIHSKPLQAFVLILTVLVLVRCGDRHDCLTVSEVWQEAEALDGEQVCVRGRAHFFTVPYYGLAGCSLDGGGELVGRLELLDEDAPGPAYYSGEQPLLRLAIGESSLQCNGDSCGMKCTPFDPGCLSPCRPERATVFKLVGVLQIIGQQDDVVLVLEDVDLEESRRFLDGEWGPIPTGTFSYEFP